MNSYLIDTVALEVFNKELEPFRYYLTNLNNFSKNCNRSYSYDQNNIFDEEKLDLAIRIEVEIYIRTHFKANIFQIYNYLSSFMINNNIQE
jgi:hypothetical protein